MPYERRIKEAFDKISGKILNADEIFDDTRDAFKIRKRFHKDEIELYCSECGQKLIVSTSKYDRLHFKHRPRAKPCLLKDIDLSPEESKKIYAIYRGKESDRHKELKYKIANKLSQVKGIKSINIDNKFIINFGEKRKPDVYCKYFDKELVFEIQLSDLPLRYILNRYEFYKRNKIYLIWILDNFDVHGQSQTERDIKYLTEFENFFKLDEKTEDFRLICTYKLSFLNHDNKLLSKWVSKSVRLPEIKFSKEFYQIYYYNFGQQKKTLEIEQTRRLNEKQEEIEKRKKLAQKRKVADKTNRIKNELRNLWKKQGYNFFPITRMIEELNEYELETLNQSLIFKQKERQPQTHHWFSIAKKGHFDFLKFMLECEKLEIDVNERSIEGESLLQTLFKNNLLENKLWLIQLILKRGYFFQKEDEPLINQLNLGPTKTQSTIILCQLAGKLHNRDLVDKLFNHSGLICIIESAKRNQIVGFGYKQNEWVAFANNAIRSYEKHWKYIEKAFLHYGLWKKLILLDKKGTYRKKLEKHYRNQSEQCYDINDLLIELYPELY